MVPAGEAAGGRDGHDLKLEDGNSKLENRNANLEIEHPVGPSLHF